MSATTPGQGHGAEELWLGRDTRDACARIERWAHFLGFVGVLSILIAALASVALILGTEFEFRVGLMALVLVAALITVIPTIEMFVVGRAFGAVPTPANAATLVAPLRALRLILRMFAVFAALNVLAVIIAGSFKLARSSGIADFVLGKQARTIATMRETAAALDAYAREHQAYPDARDIDEVLVALGRAGGDDPISGLDAWGNGFRYEPTSFTSRGPAYRLTSFGADARQDPWSSWSSGGEPEVKAKPDDLDLIIESGAFVKGPPAILGPAAPKEME